MGRFREFDWPEERVLRSMSMLLDSANESIEQAPKRCIRLARATSLAYRRVKEFSDRRKGTPIEDMEYLAYMTGKLDGCIQPEREEDARSGYVEGITSRRPRRRRR